MKHITTIEIDEIETEVSIDFSVVFGDVEISQITDIASGDAIDAEIDNYTYKELYECAADFNAIKYYTRFRNEY